MKNSSKATIKRDGYEVHYGYRIRVRETTAGKSYQVDLGRKSGRHIRRSFKVLQEARNWAYKKYIEAQNKGVSALRSSDEQKNDAVEALHVLKDFGVTLKAAASYYARHNQKVDSTNGFAPLVAQYLEEQKARVESGALRPRTYADMEDRLKPFRNQLGQMAVGAIDAKDLDKVMDRHGFRGSNRQNYKRYLSGFFNWCLRGKKLSANPVADTAVVKIERETPAIYTPNQVKEILGKAKLLHPELVPYLTIAFFAGVRPDEILRLQWLDIDLEHNEIQISTGQSKTRNARIVHLSHNLQAWLKDNLKKDGLVFPYSESSLKRWRSEVYKKARVPSIQDGARHTFATFYLALNSLDDTLQELGHTDPKMLFRHYRGLAKNRKAQAEEFFSIIPS